MIHLLAVAYYSQTHLHSIFLALVVSYAIGFAWHGPLFGKLWMKLNGMTPPRKEDVKFSMMLPGLSANFVMTVVQSAVLGRTFQLVSLANVWEALIIATILWLAFTALLLLNIYSWVGRPFKVWLLDAGHALVAILAVAAVLYWTL